MNFDNAQEYAHMPPLDRMRKIRRAILKTINDIRAAHKSPPISVDPHANKAANEYALWLLQNQEDEEKVNEICKAHNVAAAVETKVTPLVGFAMLEEEEQQVGIHDQMMDAHGLLLELEYELGVLTDPNSTHVGIGFAMTPEQVKVVELVTVKPVTINELARTDDGGIVVTGIVPDEAAGIYAARVVALSKM
jgi:hypothetical protein